MRSFLSTFFLVVLLSGFPSGSGGEVRPASGPVHIKADTISHDETSGTYRAEGRVEVEWDAATLNADRASLNQETGDAAADGHVRLMKADSVLAADSLKINIGSEKGTIENGNLFVGKSNLHVRGKTISKVGEDDYRLEQGEFTTCDGDVPSWKFAADNLEVTLEEFAVGRNAVFYVKDFPVFYTPYILFPVMRERQSGFLFPRIGSSTKKGFFLDIPYYWAISPSQDMTVNLDIQTKRGIGTGADYRYMRKHGSEGELRGYQIYDDDQSRFRGEFEGKHKEFMPDSIAAKADVNLVTDRDFFRDFSVESGIYNKQLLDSSASITKSWQDASLSGEVRYVQDLEVSSSRLTLQRLPTLNYTLLGQRLGRLPAYVSIDSGFANFYREEGQQGRRLDLHPALTVYSPLPGGGLALWGGYRQRLYQASADDVGSGYNQIGQADAGALAATSLERLYDVSWGDVRRIRHTIVPEISYRFTEKKDHSSVPFFDFNDRIPGESTLGWAVTNYVTGRISKDEAAPEYRDLLSVRLSQGWTMSGERRDLLTLTDTTRSLSDFRLEARVNPVKQLSVATDSRIDPHDFSFSAAGLSGEFNDGIGNFAGIGYRMSRDIVEYMEGRMGVTLVKPFVFNYTGRYSFDRGNFLESYYSVEYKQQCWSLTFSFRDRTDNREFLVNFTLAGIGAVGPVKAF